jgi:hypothetical protein
MGYSSIPRGVSIVVKGPEKDAQGSLRLSRRGAIAKGAEKDTQTSLRLPRELYEQLSQAAGDRGIGEEIRQRLQASFATVRPDPKTAELATAVAMIASEASRYYRPWHENRHAFDTVRAAVVLLMASYQPKGEAVPTPNPGDLADLLWGPEHSPEDVARALVASCKSQLARGEVGDA